MKLAIFGASGRMGQAVTRLAHEAADVQIVGAIANRDDPAIGRDVGEVAQIGVVGVEVTSDIGAGLLGADVVIDFSTASAVPELFALCERQGVAIVSGTTNLDERGLAALERAAKKVPVIWAPNMSRGVQVLAEVVQHAMRRLGMEFDVEIVEVHHRKKIDSPSGTAVRLADAAQEVRAELSQVRGRDGNVGARKPEELGIFGVRGGDVIGDHTVHLLGDSERLELTHRATNRDLFARGALSAARFTVGHAPGRYTIADVLGT
ncbi:MAG TPA: 4-hydroxy-tetrahydrodipicolinate reductase [Polyangiaceae bacterium]|nr:4-hydroxy-tetrahydrodipicolinate reductase [Polyangiaceae bacterium]